MGFCDVFDDISEDCPLADHCCMDVEVSPPCARRNAEASDNTARDAMQRLYKLSRSAKNNREFMEPALQIITEWEAAQHS